VKSKNDDTSLIFSNKVTIVINTHFLTLHITTDMYYKCKNKKA